MALVNRFLDAFFRTLDAVDMARERLDRALGRSPKPEPWVSEWSPVPDAPAPSAPRAPSSPSSVSAPAVAPAASKPVAKPVAKKAAPKPASKTVAKAGGSKKPTKSSRKGSVDRSGKDFDSPRAKAIVEKLKELKEGVVSEDAAQDGKRVLARVLWALSAADRAGSELGLTAADASALLHLAGGIEAFSTNVARTCREESDLIEESTPDGRSKRYKLTEAGKGAAANIATRAM
ncbi:MAG TPA: hypothetical protein VGO62_05720 [Myxococcota bacterium]|jgi:hypothetical protein